MCTRDAAEANSDMVMLTSITGIGLRDFHEQLYAASTASAVTAVTQF